MCGACAERARSGAEQHDGGQKRDRGGTGGAPLPAGDWVWVNGLWTHPVLSVALICSPSFLSFAPPSFCSAPLRTLSSLSAFPSFPSFPITQIRTSRASRQGGEGEGQFEDALRTLDGGRGH